MKEKLKILELFGGIGAPRKALERLGIDFKTVDYVEINEYQCKLYNELYNESFETQDITKWEKDIEVDMIFHGSPCQDFSMAGKRLGGDKDSGTRSSLLYETIRIVQKLKPKYVIWENVKGAIDDKNKHNFKNYIDELDKLGYVSNYKLTNAKYYGIPQARERVIRVSILGDEEFVFPKENKVSNDLEDYLDFRDKDDLTFNFYNRYKEKINAEATIEEFIDYIYKLPILKGIGTKKMGLYDFGEMDTITMPYGITGTITCRNSQNYNKKYLLDNKLYKPSPKMCWKLMGFSDEDFDKVKDNQDKYLYNAAGNSIVVNVLEAIFDKLFKEE